MKYFVAFFTLFLTLASANARLGESLDACKKRYGDSVIEGNRFRAVKDGFAVEIHFVDGKAVTISYGKVSGEKFLDKDLAILSKANKEPKKEWVKVTENGVVLYASTKRNGIVTAEKNLVGFWVEGYSIVEPPKSSVPAAF